MTHAPRSDVASATPQVDASTTSEVTLLLRRWHDGDNQAMSTLMPEIYAHLRRLAGIALAGERAGHTLQATALVHEAYLRLLAASTPRFEDRAHFFAVTARLMRRILVDHARAASAERRGGAAMTVRFEEGVDAAVEPPFDLIALDQALSGLAELRPRQAVVIELRFFAGLSVAETAELLDVSSQTVVLDTRLARAWLHARLRRRAR